MTFSFQAASSNRKTGPIATIYSSSDTCPDTCVFKNKLCYAKYGYVGMHWRRTDKVGMKFSELITGLKSLATNSLVRYNVAGDLVGKNTSIDFGKLKQLAALKLKIFTYTHKPVLKEQSKNYKQNRQKIKWANQNGLTINLSSNNPEEADKYYDLNIGPVVTVLPVNAPNTSFTPKGRKIIVCPQQNNDKITCAKCQLCAKKRSVIIGFKAHSTGKKYFAGPLKKS